MLGCCLLTCHGSRNLSHRDHCVMIVSVCIARAPSPAVPIQISGAPSFDPDSTSSVLTYSWTCEKLLPTQGSCWVAPPASWTATSNTSIVNLDGGLSASSTFEFT